MRPHLEIHYTGTGYGTDISWPEFLRLCGLAAAGIHAPEHIAAALTEGGTSIELTEAEACDRVAAHTASEAHNAYWTTVLAAQTLDPAERFYLECGAAELWADVISQLAAAIRQIAQDTQVDVLAVPPAADLPLAGRLPAWWTA